MGAAILRGVGRRLLIACVASAAFPRAGRAQVTETPVPFDSVGAVRSISPGLVNRLGLAAPVWPVHDDFVDVRLYTSSAGGYVLVVERRDGRLDRYALTAAEANTLRETVSVAMSRAGRVVATEGNARISAPARGAFVRNQMLLAAAMYAPAASALTHDAKAGTVLYLVSIGGTYFLVTDLSKHISVTSAQNALATDGALRTTAMLFGALATFDVNITTNIGATTALVGGLGGSILGFRLGKGLTDAEAKSMTTGSTVGALGALGVAGVFGLGELEEDAIQRWVPAVAVVGGLAGYFAGPAYPRGARYTVTKGDIQLIDLAGVLGVMTAGVSIASQEAPDTRLVSGVLLAGGLVGLWAGDRIFARNYDHSESDARLVALGALAGGLIGAAVPVLTESDNGSLILGSVTAGALLGTMAAEALVLPKVARPESRGADARGGLRLNLGGVALAALRRPGIYPIGQITF